MKKRFLAILVLLTLALSMLSVPVFAADEMPRVGFMVRWQETSENGGGQYEESNLENGSTLEAYTDLFESVYLKPYIEGEQYPPGSIGWTAKTYYTWEFQDVVDGVAEERGAPFNQEMVYQRSNAGSGKPYWQITARNNTETGERLKEDDSCYRVIIRKYEITGWSPDLDRDTCIGESSLDLHVRMTRVTLTDIQVTTKPVKTEYTEQESLDLSGLTVTLTYSNGTSEDVTFENFAEEGILTSPANGDFLQAGDTTITVSKDGHSDTFNITVHPTPQVEAPVFLPSGGTYTQPQSVEISTATSDAAIYYTIDGSTPTKFSTAYTGPILVDQSMSLKAIAVKSGMKNSPVSSASYIIETYDMTVAPGSLTFPTLYEGYTAPSGQTVTLTNTGTGTLNVTLPISTHYDFTPVTGWNGSTASLAPGAAATVTVKPKEGLPAGDYQDTIRFDTDQSGIYAEVTASFSVTSYGKISISPASITVYTGGTGYTGVVNDQGQSTTTSNGLPQPGFYITLPEELNQLLGGNANAENLSQLLTFNYQDEQGRTRRWTLMPYGTVEHSTNVEVDGVRTARYIYRLSPGLDETDKEIPVRLQLKNGNEVIFSDQFTPSPEELYQKYNMTLYSGNLNPANITASLTLPNGQTVTCGVESTSGELIVRGLNNKDAVTDIADDESKLSGEQITAVTLGDITYYVNGSNVEVDKREGVKLLVDKVLDEGVLTDYIQKNMTQIPDGTYAYEQRYLDLVDSNNGNAYLTILTLTTTKSTAAVRIG